MKQIKLAGPDLLKQEEKMTLEILRQNSKDISSEINPLRTNDNVKWFKRFRKNSNEKYLSNTAEKQIK